MKTEAIQKTYHIHEVLKRLDLSPEARNKEDLKLFIQEHFGSKAQFFSCSIEGMNIDQAIEFMLSRHKLNEVSPNNFSTVGADSCNH
jgi:probable metal-binding protein